MEVLAAGGSSDHSVGLVFPFGANTTSSRESPLRTLLPNPQGKSVLPSWLDTFSLVVSLGCWCQAEVPGGHLSHIQNGPGGPASVHVLQGLLMRPKSHLSPHSGLTTTL